MVDLTAESAEVLATLIRHNTVNPPGNERAAIEYLDAYLTAAGFRTVQLAAEPERPNLVATLAAEGDAGGPVLGLLSHVDTVLANPEEWRRDPWSGEIDEHGYLWGRGALDMKSQTAAEVVAAATLAREGWRPARGALRVIVVSDEETGGEIGARWICENHPDAVRCDYLLNEGAGATFELGGRRRYGVCCGEKGIFRFLLTARGRAGHASLPRNGENALLKLAPVLTRLGAAQPSYRLTEPPRELLAALTGLDAAQIDETTAAAAVAALTHEHPDLPALLEPMLGVTLAPTMAHASDKINVIPSRATLKVDCRVPPGLGEEAALAALHEVLGDSADLVEISFTEQVYGYLSPVHSPLMETIERWLAAEDPEASTVPVLLPGYSDSSWFRRAFPDLIAYGFFPHRHMPITEVAPLVHSADERIDVRDLTYATRFFIAAARDLLG
ncbi:M20/M25/M40 family metallo-hydrolase [Conexibacter sp. DBS9H8]|uniref:M20/M25/M40 family metallo-hydrolase n=1 Tax=Conexibacter sp. DBS9H8 TaxID=2937801 RepID=UPI00200EEBF6|nr:M20/M25/M40 family metallo-hydrolase [Conexibacter sp. DBS9H8]